MLDRSFDSKRSCRVERSDLSLLRRSYDCCVTVELLLLERSDVPVIEESTESKEGLIFGMLSSSSREVCEVCLMDRRWSDPTSSLRRSALLTLRPLVCILSEPLVVGRDVVLEPAVSKMRPNIGTKPVDERLSGGLGA
jgi:hypothetical protein